MKFQRNIEASWLNPEKNLISYHYVPPIDQLSTYIEGYIMGEIHADLATNYVFRSVPNGNVALVIQFGDVAVSYDMNMANPRRFESFIVGLYPLTEPFYNKFPSYMRSVMTIFKPGGFQRLFGYHAVELKSQVIDAQLIVGNKINRVREQLFFSDGIKQQLQIVNSFYSNQLKINKERKLESIGISCEINKRKGNVRISEMGKLFSTSKKNLERLFFREIGIGPKEYARIIRFNCMYDSLFRSDYTDLSESLYQMGYYDQPHFINEFRETTGYTPSRFTEIRPEARSFTDRLFILCESVEPPKL